MIKFLRGMAIIVFIISFLVPILKAQEKMNPDGYIGGTTLKIESGFDYFGQPACIYDELNISQDLSIKSWFVKLNILFPLSYKTTLFLNLSYNPFKEKFISNAYFYGSELKYTRFTASGGIYLYFKSFSK